MQILNIDIHLPPKREIPLLFIMMIFYGFVATGLYFINQHFNYEIPYLTIFFLAMNGSFLSACGISVKKHGWRAILLITIVAIFLLLSVDIFNACFYGSKEL